MTISDDRIIGKKSIMPIIEKMYDIHTWPGMMKFFKRRGFPLRRTPSGRPMILEHELIQYDSKFQEILTKNSLS